MLFQLAPVHQVYNTCEEDDEYSPVLQSTKIGISRKVNDFALKREKGTTGLAVNSTLDEAYFGHGKKKSRGAQFGGVYPCGTGKEGLISMDISALEIWGC